MKGGEHEEIYDRKDEDVWRGCWCRSGKLTDDTFRLGAPLIHLKAVTDVAEGL